MKYTVHHAVKAKYTKLYNRVSKAIASGRFQAYTRAQKRALYQRLARYERRLRQWGIAVASAAALFVVPMQAQGQITFVERTGSGANPNPFDGFDVGSNSAPTFADLDGDSDLDMVSGVSGGTFKYYRNDAGTFTELIGAGNNPFDGFDVGSFSAPTFADLDGDGDMDLVSGGNFGIFNYYRNDTGTFNEQTGGNNPLAGLDAGAFSAPTFADLDGDGDLDMVSGENGGTFKYYLNDGGTFTEQIGAGNNPFDGLDVGTYSAPTFVDLDGDGDLDLVSGEKGGIFKYYLNDGGTFTEQTGASNPLDGLDVGFYSIPTFVDLDGDGDLDLVSGATNGTFKYYENTTPLPPPPPSITFVERTGASNPLDGFDVWVYSAPTFVDLDGDSDLDMVSGYDNGNFKYYLNVGGTFTEQTGANNPFDGLDVGNLSKPTFVDLDGDGDQDLVSGEDYGTFKYYRNDVGTFTELIGAGNNPFDGLDVGYLSTPTFADLDGDSDLDLVSGNNYGTFRYYHNDAGTFTELTGAGNNPLDGLNAGANSAPTFADLDGDGDLDLVSGRDFGTFKYYRNDAGTFTEQTGGDNPFDSFDAGDESAPTFVDLDGDGDLDMVSGEVNGTFKYYENTTAALPVELLTFTGRATGASNTLQWATATEENNEGFQIERSRDGRIFQVIGWVAGQGTTQERMDYAFQDREPLTGVAYYRLRQMDYDGKSEYTDVISIVRATASNAVSIYPNPVKDQLTISNAQGQATLFNLLGQPVLDFTIESDLHILNTSELASGQYFLRIVTPTSEIITTQITK